MTAVEVWNKIYFPESGEDIFDYIEQAMREYARIKCLEAIRNTRYRVIEIIEEKTNMNVVYPAGCFVNTSSGSIRQIQDISNQDVMPEL